MGSSAWADDADHLVEIDVDDDEAAQHLHAPGDGGEPMPAAPQQHLATMVEKRLQRLLQVHHARWPAASMTLRVERDAHFQLGQPEQLLHQDVGIDAVFRFEHEPDVARRFVTDIGPAAAASFLEQRGDLLDQAALRHLVGDLGHDDL